MVTECRYRRADIWKMAGRQKMAETEDDREMENSCNMTKKETERVEKKRRTVANAAVIST
jgi:hypothetical protein